ncbi:putative Juvenile hormone epoxide hydrolase 1 [Hypsibius exemplaris]|uniref:Juvenile hormone epoxide hydrolase 1 n=1 Tax=Hypsibius exemplaris TaxID=2072580 RepID=A0A1W0WNU4_HYPEX|nr:putative Juvenile hormone epoxide hydrolase 1 [Hypsibius exemplaris]
MSILTSSPTSRAWTFHFVHIKPETSRLKTYPIALFHGWPGSFFELYKLVPLLNAPRNVSDSQAVAFEIVIPSIPGYAYSQAAELPGMDPTNVARIFDTLMQCPRHSSANIMHGRTVGRSDGRTVGRTDGRTVGRTVGRTDGRSDGRTDGRSLSIGTTVA